MPPKRKTQPSNVKTLHVELLSLVEEGKAPAEFRIFRQGMNESLKGVFKFTDDSAERVMKKAAAYGNDYSIDYAHGMFAFISADPAEAGKAAGWFRPEVRDGELWATSVSWTKKATQMLLDREYRYISPAFETDQSGEIHTLLNVALTNIPAHHALEPLVASQDLGEEEDKSNMKNLLVLLGLAENASEGEAMAKLQAVQVAHKELLQLTSKASADEALGVIKAWKAAADSVPEMHKELTALKQAQTDAERETLLTDGKRRGVVPPAYEPVLRTMELSQLKEFLKVAMPIQGRPANEPGTDQGGAVLTAQEKEVARIAGITEKAFLERKAARAGLVARESLGNDS